jgi:hypothetical protein
MTNTTTLNIALTQRKARKPRRMAREPQATTTAHAAIASPPATSALSRLDQLQTLLTRDEGASIAEMVQATGWQQHSVRGAMAGALKKRGLTVTSDKTSGTRRYHAESPA